MLKALNPQDALLNFSVSIHLSLCTGSENAFLGLVLDVGDVHSSTTSKADSKESAPGRVLEGIQRRATSQVAVRTV
jgi:hypothetical protein